MQTNIPTHPNKFTHSHTHTPRFLSSKLRKRLKFQLTVLLLLAVALRLVQGLDDVGGSRGSNINLGNTVLHSQNDGDAQTLELEGLLGDIVTNLLGGQTQGTDLGGEGGRVGNLTTKAADGDLPDLSGVEFRRHLTVG